MLRLRFLYRWKKREILEDLVEVDSPKEEGSMETQEDSILGILVAKHGHFTNRNNGTWMKEKKDNKKREETKLLLSGMAELIDKHLGKRKDRKKKKKETYEEEPDSDLSESSEEENCDSSSYAKKGKKKSGKKGKRQEWQPKREVNKQEINTISLPMKELMDSLNRIENRIKGVETRNKNVEMELEELRNRNHALEERNLILEEKIESSDSEQVRDILRRGNEERERNDKWREVQSRFKGKEGTAELKKWCQDNEIQYKNKDNALMAVMAEETKDI